MHGFGVLPEKYSFEKLLTTSVLNKSIKSNV